MGSLLMAVNFVLQYCEGSQFLKQLVYRATLPFTIRSKIFICTSCLNQISILDVFLTFVLNNKLFRVKATKYRNSNLGYVLALKISKLAAQMVQTVNIFFSTMWLIDQL